MSRLIDADALMQTLGITDMDCEKCGWYSRAYRRCKRGGDFEDACCAIEDAPTIEAVPERKKGRWRGTNDAECNQCGHVYPLFIRWQNYCPNCGARMEGAEDYA